MEMLKVKSDVERKYKLPYDGKLQKKIGNDGYNSFFNNTDKTNCPITSCKIFDGNCKDADTNIRFVSLGPNF